MRKNTLLIGAIMLLSSLGINAQKIVTDKPLLTSYLYNKDTYAVKAMVFNTNTSWNDWRDQNGGLSGIILGTPPADANGNPWYAPAYQLTDTDDGTFFWEDRNAPFGTGTWANTDISADIYFRRSFTLNDAITGSVAIGAALDDTPCEIYINGVAAISLPDKSEGWSESATFLLTDEQKAAIKTDGTENILAMHVHTNWGGSNADAGLYLIDESQPLNILNTRDWGTQYGNIATADLMNDGQKEIIICGEGFYKGRAKWMLKKIDGQWKDVGYPIDCTDRASLNLCDINGDGTLDIVTFDNVKEVGPNDNFSHEKGIYLGNGDGTFKKLSVKLVDAEATLPDNFAEPISNILNIRSSSVADFNNDGLLDIVGIGYDATAPANVVLLNQGIENDEISLKPIYFDPGITDNSTEERGYSFGEGFVSTADFNNDGHPDFVVSANNADYRKNIDADWERFTEVYINDGDGTSFTRSLWGANNPSVFNGGIGLADFNGDGFIDIVAAGDGGFWPGTPYAQIMTGGTSNGYWERAMLCLNDGTGHFTPAAVEDFSREHIRGLNSVSNTMNAYDWNGDGKMDLLFQGWCPEYNKQVGLIWINKGNGAFERTLQFAAGSESATTMTDWDGDGIKDILTTGYDDNREYVSHNINNKRTFQVTKCTEEATTAPLAPQAVNATVENNVVTINWTPATDATEGTTYELYIKNADGKLFGNCRAYISGENEGLRKVEELGNLGYIKSIAYTLPDGDYTIGVQAVNGRRDGSKFTVTTAKVGDGTGIVDVNAQTEEKSFNIYNINGQFVGNTTHKLGKGVYFINGKKVLMK